MHIYHTPLGYIDLHFVGSIEVIHIKQQTNLKTNDMDYNPNNLKKHSIYYKFQIFQINYIQSNCNKHSHIKKQHQNSKERWNTRSRQRKRRTQEYLRWSQPQTLSNPSLFWVAFRLQHNYTPLGTQAGSKVFFTDVITAQQYWKNFETIPDDLLPVKKRY